MTNGFASGLAFSSAMSIADEHEESGASQGEPMTQCPHYDSSQVVNRLMTPSASLQLSFL